MDRARAQAAPALSAATFDPPALNSIISRAADPAPWGDAVILRKDTPTSYHLAVVVDDAAQGVTHVVRGADLEEATSLHRLLQELLGLPAPSYHHHRLITGADGNKLSKSLQSKSLAELRSRGQTAADIRQILGLTV